MPDAFAAQERVIGDGHRNLQLPAKRLAVSSLHYTYTAGDCLDPFFGWCALMANHK